MLKRIHGSNSVALTYMQKAVNLIDWNLVSQLDDFLYLSRLDDALLL